jgi:gliding motility-associated-like protein
MKYTGYLLVFVINCLCSGLTAQNITINIDTISKKCEQGTFKFTYTSSIKLLNITSTLWDFGNGTISYDSIPPVIQYNYSGIYHIKLWINKTDSTETTVIIPPCLDVPNVFTPNNDGINDQLKITYLGDGFISFKVFTRAGIMIFSTEGKNIEWDGFLESGEKVNRGIYYYVIEGVSTSMPVSRKGFFYVFY